ncbi:C40 family peptidase [Bacillus sp. V59.32b]|uniref:coiled-coil domain-containing protein n=1 Tax=Bacillus sp. V59.32b TaxID=1758642 RepID=UPI000E3CF9AB|nr:C40 family peptidase [Bacillus sp. V59.32b]RFU60113.1 peptidase [Bacillus sp. V59.32b]
MLRKKLIALNTTIVLGLGSFFALPALQAEANKAEVQEERSGIQEKIKGADKEISYLQEKQAALNEQIKRSEQAIKDNTQKIDDTKKQITDTKSEVDELKKEIPIIEDRILKRNEVLKERALSFQESGGDVSYLEVLLGSSSFRNFVDRVGAVATIVEADREILEQHEADKEELKTKKAAVEKKLAGLNESRVELEGMMAQIKEQESQAKTMKEDLNQQEQLAVALKADLQDKDGSLATLENSLQDEMVAEPVSTVSYKGKGNKSIAVRAGNKYIGNSVYVFGGGRTASDIANGRFDCSGFVAWAYSQAGIKLPAHTDALKNSGSQISYSQIQPGDLVFFDTYKKDGHVGIYVGGGKFIGSQSSTGVAIVNMTSGYWGDKFNGRVVRI